MKNVLLVIAAGTDAPNAIAYALRRAREIDGGLLGLAVLDRDLTQRVATTLANAGFVGEKVSENVVDALAREQRTQAEDIMKQIAAQANELGVAFTSIVEEGDAGDICGRIIQTHNVQTAVLVAEKRSWLARLLSGSAAVQLPTLAGCDVTVMDD